MRMVISGSECRNLDHRGCGARKVLRRGPGASFRIQRRQLPRIGTGEHSDALLHEALLWLLSDAARYVSGKILSVAGGR